MKNTFGNQLQLTIFGESHGPAIGATLAGISSGIKVDKDFIAEKLLLRSAQGELSTARQEKNGFKIVSGVFNGYTTGTALTILIPNEDTRSKDYAALANLPRPGHADFTAFCKYHGFQDYRGGGHFSGRITAAIVAICAICEQALLRQNILISTHIKECAGISDRTFNQFPDPEDLAPITKKLNLMDFAVIDERQGQKMKEAILAAKAEGDSVGGILETVILGLEAGLGEPWFDSIESLLAHALFSIPAVKGVSFGDGFALSKLRGSAANDAPVINADRRNNHQQELNSTTEEPSHHEISQNDLSDLSLEQKLRRISFESNHNGGINGGISNGMPILFSTVIKPTASIKREQTGVDLKTMRNTALRIEGRHDPAIVHRARQVVNSLTAFVVCDLLTMRHGTDFLADENYE